VNQDEKQLSQEELRGQEQELRMAGARLIHRQAEVVG
jgi:hypothetical protein